MAELKLTADELCAVAVARVKAVLGDLDTCTQSGDWADAIRECGSRLYQIGEAIAEQNPPEAA